MPAATPFPAARTAVVTGAASVRGIGHATAHRLAAEGWSVAVLDLDDDACRATAAEVADGHDVPTAGIGTDVADQASVDSALTRVEATLPPVVGLANVAGVSSPTPFLEVTADEWDRVLDINLKGTFLVTQRVVRGMVERRLGRVVSVSSVSAQRGGGTYSKVPYSAAKAGILGLTRAVAREVGAYGVTVNAVSPGPVDTDIMGGRLSDERKAELVEQLMVGRVGTVDDIAALMCFLLSEDAGFITAATYDINGGQHVS
jgi:2-hydroxycyclohexanecarboxyl-CoA dehydrogenase